MLEARYLSRADIHTYVQVQRECLRPSLALLIAKLHPFFATAVDGMMAVDESQRWSIEACASYFNAAPIGR